MGDDLGPSRVYNPSTRLDPQRKFRWKLKSTSFSKKKRKPLPIWKEPGWEEVEHPPRGALEERSTEVEGRKIPWVYSPQHVPCRYIQRSWTGRKIPKPKALRTKANTNRSLIYKYHNNFGYKMEDCYDLRDIVEHLIWEGRLAKYIVSQRSP